MDGLNFATYDQAVILKNNQVGIFTRAKGSAPSNRPAFVILNTGILHRVGRNRMYVLLARRLAAAGCPVLRFDFSGIGDSEPRDDGLPLLEACHADIREALDWLESSHNIRQTVILGLCSGADIAVTYAWADQRIIGCILIDPTIPTTRRYQMHKIVNLASRPGAWPNLTNKQSWLKIVRNIGAGSVKGTEVTRNFYSEYYEKLAACTAHLLILISRDKVYRHGYRHHFFDVYPELKGRRSLSLELIDNTDHFFTLEANRNRLFHMIDKWLEKLEIPVLSE